MVVFTSVVEKGEAGEPTLSLALSHEQRRRARLRLVLPGGEEVGLKLPRGVVLRDGDCLRSEDGTRTARVAAAPESVSRASTPDPHLLARAAYHLGNRHVPLQVEQGFVLYPHDHVLDGMCRELGLTVEARQLPFEPELGGYGHGGHAHHDHDHHEHHGHDHDHDHEGS